jgi:tetrahydromethanopterin S-methyltransferase subunit F
MNVDISLFWVLSPADAEMRSLFDRSGLITRDGRMQLGQLGHTSVRESDNNLAGIIGSDLVLILCYGL